jgi:hypothetical protein
VTGGVALGTRPLRRAGLVIAHGARAWNCHPARALRARAGPWTSPVGLHLLDRPGPPPLRQPLCGPHRG